MSPTINGVELPQSARAVAPERVVPPLSLRGELGQVLYWAQAAPSDENLYELALTPDGNAIFIKDPEEAFAAHETIEQNSILPAGWEGVSPQLVRLLLEEPSRASPPESPGWASGGTGTPRLPLTINGVLVRGQARAITPQQLAPPLTPLSQQTHVLYWVSIQSQWDTFYRLAGTLDGYAVAFEDATEAAQACEAITAASQPPPGWTTLVTRLMGVLAEQPTDATQS